MSVPRVVAIDECSPAARAGLQIGDELLCINGRVPKDVLEYRWLVDEADLLIELRRGSVELEVMVDKDQGAALGIEVHSAVFDRVMTCDNHCAFCFIYQLPPGMRRSLYLKDDDYRLSFLYGNFTTLTRFTEADLERVLDEGLTPLHVSIHATDPAVRSEMLRNRRGATSLRWLRALLDAGVSVHGQVVVCPGVNDGAVLDDTMAGILDRFAELASVCIVPLGLSRYNTEATMRAHTPEESRAVVATVERWQAIFLQALGRRLVFASDEYYLAAGASFPPAADYGDFAMYEDGVGMARAFEAEFTGATLVRSDDGDGFFAAVDGAPASGYRAPRSVAGSCGTVATESAEPASRSLTATSVHLGPRADAPVTVLTGAMGAAVLRPILDRHGYDDVEVVAVANRFFGGTTAVTGLMVGEDLQATLAQLPERRRYIVPDVCLSQGRFLDGMTPDQLCRPVEVVPTDGAALRRLLDVHERTSPRRSHPTPARTTP